MMTERIFACAVLPAKDLDGQKQELLRLLCEVSESVLISRLRDGLMPEDCGEAFVTAAAWYALADLNAVAADLQVKEFKAGDLTVKQDSTEDFSRRLRKQADLLMAPYLKDAFSFTGV